MALSKMERLKMFPQFDVENIQSKESKECVKYQNSHIAKIVIC